MLAGALAVSALALVAWFPASALYHQHQQVACLDGRAQPAPPAGPGPAGRGASG